MSDGAVRQTDGRYHEMVFRLDAATELMRGVLRRDPRLHEPGPDMAAEVVRATGMAAGKLAELHTLLGRLYASRLDEPVVAAWRDAVYNLRVLGESLPDVASQLRLHRS
jgi:hypothetical protein